MKSDTATCILQALIGNTGVTCGTCAHAEDTVWLWSVDGPSYHESLPSGGEADEHAAIIINNN